MVETDYNFAVDINECAADNGGCAHNCANNVGGYACSCDDGYELNEDKHNCTGKVYCHSWKEMHVHMVMACT